MHKDFSTVTELPGIHATREQLSMLYTRYHFARRFCRGRDVLEVACGSGMGLGYLARCARRVVGGDIDECNLREARKTCENSQNAQLQTMDAHKLPFVDDSFDTIILFEALYYLEHPARFLREARRVLRPGGVLLICTVNCQWSGFHPSPYSTGYFSAERTVDFLTYGGFSAKLYGAFPDQADSLKDHFVAAVRRIAVAWDLVPRTMKGKRLLKRLFYGRVVSLERQVCEGMAPLERLVDLSCHHAHDRFKVLYAVARSLKPAVNFAKAA